MKTNLFEAFIKMIESLPASGILLVVELQGEMIENDLSQRRILPIQEAVSVLDFCRFVQAVARGGGIFPTVLPMQHLAPYRKIVKRLIQSGELPPDADELFDRTFLSICTNNHWLFVFNNEGVERHVESAQFAA